MEIKRICELIDERKDELFELLSSLVKINSLSSDEEKTLEFIKTKKEIFRQDLEKYLSCSKTKCNNILNSLLKKGLINKKDSGKNVKYNSNS